MRCKIFEKNQIENILNMFSENNQIKEIAKKYNCYPQVIQNLLKREIGYKPTQVKTKNIRYFQKIDSKLKAYFAGFIAADGAIVKNELTISIHRKDISILEKIKKELESPNKIISLNKHNTDMVRFSVGNKNLKNDLNNLGITSRKTFSIGNILNNIPNEYKSSFILGYFDGDGSFSFNQRKGLFSIRGTQELLNGFSEYLDLDFSHIKKYDSTYDLREWKQSEILRIYKKLYSNQEFFLNRKFQKFNKYITNVYGQEETISSSQ